MAQIIARSCVACPSPLEYVLDTDSPAPSVLPPLGAIAYRDGHLCTECARKCEAALRPVGSGAMTFFYCGSTRSAPVASLPEAVAVWEAYLARTGFGASDAGNGGHVLGRDGKVIARISYNGKITMGPL